MKFASILGMALLCCVAATSPAQAQSNCEKLKDLKLENASVTSAESVAAGPFKLPPGLVPSVDVPAFCRVKAELKPSSDSLIKMELWLPADGWNGKFEQVGNGGLAGSINLLQLATAMKSGFAAAGTDD